ncbi:MAG: hypothetical protein ACRYGP_10535 [Janthinobacterium lividum]
MLVLALLWWLPTLLLVLARWQGGRLRLEIVMGLGRALVALGWPEVAAGLYEAEAERAERSLRALKGRR